MNNPAPVQPQLPDSISSPTLELRSMSVGAWNYIEKLGLHHRRDAPKHRMRETWIPGFVTQGQHNSSVAMLAHEDKKFPLNYDYWIIDKPNQKIVGTFAAYPSANEGTPISLYVSIHKSARRQGHASAAINLFTNFVLGTGIVPGVAADTTPNNKGMVHIMDKLGFAKQPSSPGDEYFWYTKFSGSQPSPEPQRPMASPTAAPTSRENLKLG